MRIYSLLIAFVFILLLASCNPNQAWKKHKIDSKEKSIMEEAKKGKIDTIGLKELLVAYDAYVTAFPTDSGSANYLFKEADFYRYMHKPVRSIQIYARIYDDYPQYFKRPYALFLQGFIYENEIRNLDSARVKYESFLTIYPNHPIAKDVRITLSNMGKTPEQLIHEFEEKQKADSLLQSSSK
jgi:tetratricopeptide (TPR) repeat protein